MLAHLDAHNWIAWEDVDADTARALHALLSDSAPFSTVAEHSGADTAAGEGVPSEERRACWTCKHDRKTACARIDAQDAMYLDLVNWTLDNCRGDGIPYRNAENCPGWAPKSGEVSDG